MRGQKRSVECATCHQMVPLRILDAHERDHAAAAQSTPDTHRSEGPVFRFVAPEMGSSRLHSSVHPMSAQTAPVCRPTAEEWADPLRYVRSLLSLGRKCGILRVVPPSDAWPVPPMVDGVPEEIARSRARFPTKVQNIHQLKHRESRAEAFFVSLEMWLEKQGLEEDLPPMIDGHHIDCFQLLLLVRREYGTDPFSRQPRLDWNMLWKKYCELPCAFAAMLWATSKAPTQQAARLQWIFLSYLKEYEEAMEDAPAQELWKGTSDAEVRNFGYPTGKPRTLQDYREIAAETREELGVSSDCSVAELERLYWLVVERGDHHVQVEYANDLPIAQHGSGFPTNPKLPMSRHPWNLNNLPLLPAGLFHHMADDVQGVTTPMLYVGSLFTSFAWHVEDNFLYSINYNHSGATKVWYGVGSDHAVELERVMRQTLPHLFERHPDLLHQLVTMVSPADLKRNMVPVYRTLQRAGEFVITFPRAYHAGFNTGFNVAEAVNFAVPDWIPFGVMALENYRGIRRVSAFSHEELIMRASRGFPLRSVAEPLLYELHRLATQEDDMRFAVHNKGVLYFQAATEHGEVPQCDECQADCYFSCIMCGCSTSTRVCLADVDALPCRGTCAGKFLYKRVTMQNLKELMLKLEARLNIHMLCKLRGCDGCSTSVVPYTEQDAHDEATANSRKRARTDARLRLPLLSKLARQGGIKRAPAALGAPPSKLLWFFEDNIAT